MKIFQVTDEPEKCFGCGWYGYLYILAERRPENKNEEAAMCASCLVRLMIDQGREII